MRHPRYDYETAAAGVGDIEFGTTGGFITSVGSRPVASPAFKSANAVDLRQPALEGYATRWFEAHQWEGRTELFSPDCFNRSLADGSDIKFLIMHDDRQVLGSTRAGTLQLIVDRKGLAFRLMLPDAAIGRLAEADVRGGIKCQMSVGYGTLAAEWKTSWDGMTRHRLINDCRLAEISLVDLAAVPKTSVRLVEGHGAVPLHDAIKSFNDDVARDRERAAADETKRRAAAEFDVGIDERTDRIVGLIDQLKGML